MTAWDRTAPPDAKGPYFIGADVKQRESVSD